VRGKAPKIALLVLTWYPVLIKRTFDFSEIPMAASVAC
jgi:hypothetical protein